MLKNIKIIGYKRLVGGVECGGIGTLDELMPFHYTRTLDNKITILHPSNFKWIIDLVYSVKKYTYKGKKPINFIFLVTELVGDDGIIGGITLNKTRDTIIIGIRPKAYKNLIQSKPYKNISDTLKVLIEVIYHELYHFKYERGNSEASEDDIKKIHEIMKSLK